MTQLQNETKAKLKLRDLVLLVASMACGLGIIRLDWDARVGRWHREFLRERSAWGAVEYFVHLLQVIVPVLYSWSVVLSWRRLASSRCRFRRLLLQPGAVASFTGTLFFCHNVVAVVFGLAWTFIRSSVEWRTIAIYKILIEGDWASPMFFGFDLYGIVGPAVSIATLWLFLVASRLRRSDASWMESFGRVLGVTWIIVGVTYYVDAIQEQIAMWGSLLTGKMGGFMS